MRDPEIESILREMLDLMRQRAVPSPEAARPHHRADRFGRGRQDRLAVGLAIGVLVGVIALLLVSANESDRSTVSTAASLTTSNGDEDMAIDAQDVGGAATTSGPPDATGAVSAPITAGASVGSPAATRPRPPDVPATRSAGPSAAGPPVRGVTATKIRIGIGIPGKAADALTGDAEGYYAAVLDEWRRTKQVPVHGRDIEFVYHRWDLASPSGQRAGCIDLAQDEKVFATLGLGFDVGGECLTKEYKMPLVTGGGVADEERIRRGWPYMFWTNMTMDRVLRNWPHWAAAGGHLENKRIGIYLRDTPEAKAIVERNFKPQLAKLGYAIAAEATQGEQGSEALAVQRFKLAGIQVVFLMTNPGGFTQAATAQSYKPAYLVSEYDSSGYTADGVPATQGFVPDQLDGAFAMTYYRRAENGLRGNPPVPSAGDACVQNYARYSNQRPYSKTDPAESIKWDTLQHACDAGRALIKALHVAGPGLNELRLVRALESTHLQASGEMADITFSGQKHNGADLVKSLEFSKECVCWNTIGPFRPLWIP